jgi:uroporphyrin-III C-methyltransferase/precorrin-2 dehydrogenase/sirohydrochlorin ferrochelatase
VYRPGFVYLVGAGPGDPELLTLAAAKRIRAADVIVYDHLVNETVLDLARAGAQLVYAGKERSYHSMQQREINALLVAKARAGKCVVRLKGGDPFIFGRGGEEMEALAAQGIGCEVVPGVTSASGASCYAGIPLTHRDYAQACVFVTGHLKNGTCGLDWPALARPHQTVVIYMGLGSVGEIARQLIAHGRSAETPAAAIERATTTAQRVVTAPLRELTDAVARAALCSPTVLIVGEVVALHGKLEAADQPARSGTRSYGYDVATNSSLSM